jgi:polyisoprenyl-phosphate glycosyltransferase
MATELPRIAVVIPVHNDWESAQKLLASFPGMAATVHAVVVDDGSTEVAPKEWALSSSIVSAEIMSFELNQGHQRAIAAGICEVVRSVPHDYVLVMDGDGEDPPDAIPLLLSRQLSHPDAIVVASRGVRTEGVRFKLFYSVFKRLFSTLTGWKLDFGNFSLMPAKHAHSLAMMPELWNHYPSAVIRSGKPIHRLRTDRGMRYFGSSKMNFLSLVSHGLSAMGNFFDVIFVRLLWFASLFTAASLILLLSLVTVRLSDWVQSGFEEFTPGWGTIVSALLAFTTIQVWLFAATGTMLAMINRQTIKPIPLAETAQLPSVRRSISR